MKSSFKTLIPTIIFLICLNVAGQNTEVDIPSKKLLVGGDPNKTYFLIGPKKGEKHSQIRNVQEKPERFQDFREFKILWF